MSKGIPVSAKHGLNPMITCCELCGVDVGVALLGKLPGDREAPHRGRVPALRCDACRDRLRDHNCIMRVDADKRPTGEAIWISETTAREHFDGDDLAGALRARVCLFSAETWANAGLPVHGTPEWDAHMARIPQPKQEDE